MTRNHSSWVTFALPQPEPPGQNNRHGLFIGIASRFRPGTAHGELPGRTPHQRHPQAVVGPGLPSRLSLPPRLSRQPQPGPHQPHQRNPRPTNATAANPTAANPTPPRHPLHRCFPAPASGTAPRKNSAETSRSIVAGLPRQGQEPLERLALGFECRLPSSSITPPLRREPRHPSRHGPLSSAPHWFSFWHPVTDPGFPPCPPPGVVPIAIHTGNPTEHPWPPDNVSLSRVEHVPRDGRRVAFKPHARRPPSPPDPGPFNPSPFDHRRSDPDRDRSGSPGVERSDHPRSTPPPRGMSLEGVSDSAGRNNRHRQPTVPRRSPPHSIPQRANISSALPHRFRRTVGPLGLTERGGEAPRACDPGWENGWPVGPDDDLFGPERREPHQHPSVPTGGRPPHENDRSFPAPGVTSGDPPHRKPTPGPTGQPLPQPGPAGRERSPPTTSSAGPTGQQFLLARNVARTIDLASHQPRTKAVVSTARVSPAQLSRPPAAPLVPTLPTTPAPRKWCQKVRFIRTSADDSLRVAPGLSFKSVSVRLPNNPWSGGWLRVAPSDSNWRHSPRLTRPDHRSNAQCGGNVYPSPFYVPQGVRLPACESHTQSAAHLHRQGHGFPHKSVSVRYPRTFPCGGPRQVAPGELKSRPAELSTVT